jgi:hypothetical protein
MQSGWKSKSWDGPISYIRGQFNGLSAEADGRSQSGREFLVITAMRRTVAGIIERLLHHRARTTVAIVNDETNPLTKISIRVI